MALADVRDSIAVTLMGWCAKLATKQYQGELAELYPARHEPHLRDQRAELR